MNIRIIGGGSIGLLLAGRLAAVAGADAADKGIKVEIICRRPEQARSIQQFGITIQSAEERDVTLFPAVSSFQDGDHACDSGRTERGEQAAWDVFRRTESDDRAETVVPVASGGQAERGARLAGREQAPGVEHSHGDQPADEKSQGAPDWLLLAVKQKDIDDRLGKWLARMYGRNTKIVCFQNGLGHEEQLALHLPRSSIYMAVTTEGARKCSANTVKHTGRGMTRIGKAFAETSAQLSNNGASDEQLSSNSASGEQCSFNGASGEQMLLSLLRQAGFDAEWCADIDRYVWNKLVINSIINPLTALAGVKNGELLRDPDSLLLAKSLLAEAREVAGRRGIRLDDTLWEQVVEVCRRTADNESSMLQDVRSGRRTEVDWINGSFVRIAQEERVDAPVQRTVYHLIKSIDNKNLQRDSSGESAASRVNTLSDLC